jgi:aminotransferase
MRESSVLKPTLLVESISKSEIRNMTDECERRGGINLSQGVCDLPIGEVIRDAACAAIHLGRNCYTHHCGLEELRTAIAEKAQKFNRVPCTPENVIVSAGATGALYCAVMALLKPGDEVIVFEPYYGYHVNTLRAHGLVPVYCRLSDPDWKIDFGLLDKAVTHKTKAVLINTPANPSGKVFSLDELKTLAILCKRHNLFVLTDEIYEHFTYDGYDHVSPASVPELREQTITISGCSKVFSITGWRVGYCIAPASVAEAIGYVNDLVYVCAPSPLQVGVATALNKLDEGFYSDLRLTYQVKRDKLCHALKDAGLSPCVPRGAYYILADATRIPGKNSKGKAMWLLEQGGIATVPGEAFFHNGSDNLLRFCFAKDDKVIDLACQRLAKLHL